MKKSILNTWLSLLMVLFLFPVGCEPDPSPDRQYTITVIASPVEGGTVTGGGIYLHNVKATVTAAPNSGYEFLNWTVNDAIASTDLTYTFNVISNRTLVANFEERIDPRNPFNPELNYGEITDPRDGQIYKTIQIGTQTWMAENLNYVIGDSYCHADDAENCDIYGKLYPHDLAMIVCPPGWHLPSKEEWEELIYHLGGESVAGGRLKSKGTVEDGTGYWKNPNTSGTNESGWSGLPGGNRYSFLGERGLWWSSSDADREHYYIVFRLDYNKGSTAFGLSRHFKSVRCIKD